MKKNKVETEELRKDMKEEIYTKYTDISNSLMGDGYYEGFKSTLSTFLALNMCAEAAKNNLVKMGMDRQPLEEARRTIIKEIWELMGMYEKGTLQKLIADHADAQNQQAEKK